MSNYADSPFARSRDDLTDSEARPALSYAVARAHGDAVRARRGATWRRVPHLIRMAASVAVSAMAPLHAVAASAPAAASANVAASAPVASSAVAALAAASAAKPATANGASTAAATSAAPATATAGTSPEKMADLVYQSFVESGDLANAQKIAEEQVRRDPRSAVWTKRLAQVAEWQSNGPLALKSWLDYADLSNDPVAWSNVLRIAPMLDDDNAYLAALTHAARANPDDLKTVDNVTATYERLGRPDDGLTFLRSLPRDRNEDAIDQRIGALAERAGHDDQALAAYRAVQARHPTDPNAALRTASVLYRQGDYRASLAALQTARHGAKDKDTEFWRDYAELARLLQRDDDANEAYRHLLVSGDTTPEDLGDMTYFYDPYPIDAGRVAELRYRRDHTPRALQDAIYYYTDAQALDRVAALIASLTPDERRAAEMAPGVLGVRAEYYRLTDQPDLALADLKRAINLPGATSDLRAAYLWMLVDYGTDAELNATLRRWRGNEDQSSALWEPFAAAEMRMNRPVRALSYLHRQAAVMSRDPLWLLTYADAQEMSGRPDLAWTIRHKVWLQMQQDEAELAKLHDAPRSAFRGRAGQDAETRADLRARRVALAGDFAPADESAALLNDLLSGPQSSTDTIAYARRTLLGTAKGLPGGAPMAGTDKPQPNRLREAVAKEVAIAWALSHEANPLAKRWLAQQYAAHLAQPADARLTIALAEHDNATIEKLLAQERSRLPLYDRIDATLAVDRLGRAQQLAFDGLDGAPDDTELHTRLAEAAFELPESIDTSVTNYVEHPLDYVEQTVSGSRRIADQYLIGVEAVQHFQHSTDITQLVNVPSVDRWADVYIKRQTLDTSFTVTAGRRDAMTAFNTLQFALETGRNSDIQFSLHAGRDQVADENQALLVGGMKDNVVSEVTWRVTPRISIQGSVEGDRFYSQSRSYLGSGVLTSGEIEYRIRTDYPDYTLRLVGEHGSYGASGGVDPLMSRLVPTADQPALATDFLPPTFSQYGLFFGFGNENRDRYTHEWRPFLDVGIVHDSIQGWGPDVTVGAAGSVFGNDHLMIFFEHESVSRVGTGTPITVIGARYNWYY
ncbi:tetratricopeptide repeat protein [Paraburkholderia phosphatilytica]|uniref:tetratricopeptide repeat protein n=1 Tax=Paraburkholderia phosphatilytica TaxID=2282883 RepID=UPI001F0CCAA8|nr:tetratricopeptide repeat protein [Paraburkholderia phosphatilytica]